MISEAKSLIQFPLETFLFPVKLITTIFSSRVSGDNSNQHVSTVSMSHMSHSRFISPFHLYMQGLFLRDWQKKKGKKGNITNWPIGWQPPGDCSSPSTPPSSCSYGWTRIMLTGRQRYTPGEQAATLTVFVSWCAALDLVENALHMPVSLCSAA